MAVLALVVGLTGRAGAEQAGPGFFDMGGMGRSKEPITVTADRLDYDYKGNVIVYRGDVEAVQGEAKLRSDTLTVTLQSTPKAGQEGAAAAKPRGAEVPASGSSRVQEIVAVGNVRIDQGTRWATGGRAVFDQGQRTVVLTESPVLHDGPNEVVGDRVIVYLDENRSVVEGGRKRVKAVLHPDKGNTNGAPASGAPAKVARP